MQALLGRQQTTNDSSRKRKYSNRPPCGVNTFPLKKSAEIVQLTSKFVWTGVWLTLLFKEDSILPQFHNHDSNTHNAHTHLLQLTSKFVWTVFGRSCALSKMNVHPPTIPQEYQHVTAIGCHSITRTILHSFSLSPRSQSGPARPRPRPDQHYSLHRPGPARPNPQPGPTRTHPRRALNSTSGLLSASAASFPSPRAFTLSIMATRCP